MTSVNVPYFTVEIRTQVLKLLGLKQDSFKKGMVRVLASDKEESGKRRVLLHYDVEALEKLQSKPSFTKKERDEIVALSACRGIIVDLKTMKVIKKSFPQTVNIPTAFVPRDVMNSIMTSEGPITPEWGVYKSCYGGSLLHAYHYEGEFYLSTFRHHDVTNSHFGDSDNFVASWLKNQDVFGSIADLYPIGSDLDLIHIFILNDRKLLVDTRENQDEDRVIYLKSFSMTDPYKLVDLTDQITDANKSANKPISFCKILTADEVNARLRGSTIDVSDDYEGDRFQLYGRFQYFFGGEKVIYEHTFGICTLVPPSCKFRQQILEGKNNIGKLFVDCMADVRNDKDLSDVAFGFDDCLKIAEKLQDGETIYIDKYTLVTDNKQLQVLTNLLFTVPLNRIAEVIIAYNDFDLRLEDAVVFLIDSHDELSSAIKADGLTTYPGITSVKFREYLCKHLPNLVYSECELNEHWPEVLKRFFGKAYKANCSPDADQEYLVRSQINMGLIAMIGNAYGDILYTFLTFEEKVRKAKLAAEKRSMR